MEQVDDVHSRAVGQHVALGQRLQGALGGVPAADGDGRRQFVEHVRVRAGRVEGQVAGSAAGAQGDSRCSSRRPSVRAHTRTESVPRSTLTAHRPLGSGCTWWACGPCWRWVCGPEPVCWKTSEAAGARVPSGADGHRGDAAGAVVGGQDVAVDETLRCVGPLPPTGTGAPDSSRLVAVTR